MPWRTFQRELDDGYAIHAPVGAFAPNPFGLHDVHGNVLEWCRDNMAPFLAGELDSVDGLHLAPDQGVRAARGGSYNLTATDGRIAKRFAGPPDFVVPALGLRPVRRLAGAR